MKERTVISRRPSFFIYAAWLSSQSGKVDLPRSSSAYMPDGFPSLCLLCRIAPDFRRRSREKLQCTYLLLFRQEIGHLPGPLAFAQDPEYAIASKNRDMMRHLGSQRSGYPTSFFTCMFHVRTAELQALGYVPHFAVRMVDKLTRFVHAAILLVPLTRSTPCISETIDIARREVRPASGRLRAFKIPLTDGLQGATQNFLTKPTSGRIRGDRQVHVGRNLGGSYRKDHLPVLSAFWRT